MYCVVSSISKKTLKLFSHKRLTKQDVDISDLIPIQVQHYTFFCGNETIFDQLSLSCSYPEDSIPCESSPDFFYLNNNFGSDGPSITDEDLAGVQSLIAKYDQAAQSK